MKDNSVKEAILDAFHKMVYEKGLRKTNLDDLAKELKISKKTIYKYFQSKDKLVTSVVDGIISDVTEINEKAMTDGSSPIEKYMNTFTGVGNYLMKINPQFMKDIQILYPELWNKIENIRSQRLSLFYEIIRDGVNDGTFRAMNPTVAVQVITASISAVLNPGFLTGHSLTTEEAVDDLKRILLNGIRNSDMRL